MCKVITIPSLVWLRRTVQRWRTRAARLPSKLETTAAAADHVPAGHVAVRALGGRRFVVRLAHLNHPAFRELLRQAEEEYGFPFGASGPVALPCDEDSLRDVLHRVSSSAEEGRHRSSCGARGTSVRARRGDSLPLLQGMPVEKLVW